MPNFQRRNLLVRSAMGFGSLSLRSLITGLPVSFLLAPISKSFAQTGEEKYLIMSHQSRADPANTNAPGTYPVNPGDANDPLTQIAHPTVAELGAVATGYETPTSFSLGQKTVLAAQPWSTLDADLRANLAFWNHGTYTNAHPDFDSVMAFNGAIKGPEGTGTDQLDSLIATHTRAGLGTVLTEPLCIGGPAIEFTGRNQPVLKPTDIQGLFLSDVSNLDQMLALRDHFVDQVYADIKTHGTPAHRAFMDRYALSQQEANTMGDNLGALITDIDGNDTINQAKMAVALIQLNLTPVVTLGMEFGGDNHADINLLNEVTETNQSMQAINTLWQRLKAANLENKTVFASLNVFGRTLLRNTGGGRDHNGSHHSLFTFGPNIQPGVIGGIEPIYNNRNELKDFKARAIDAASGNASDTGDIPFEQTLVAVGKTLAKAVGIDDQVIDTRFDGGKVITGALLS